MAINRDYSREILDLKFPHGFRTTELLQPHAQDALNALCIDLGRAANRMEIHATVFLAGFLRLCAHAPFSDHCLHAEALDNIGLIRFFAYRSCRSRRHNAVLPILFQDDGAAVVNDAVSNGVELPSVIQILMHRIPACENDAVKQYDIPDFQLANITFAQGRTQPHHVRRR